MAYYFSEPSHTFNAVSYTHLIWYGLNMQLIIYLYALQQEGLDRYRARLTAALNEIVPAGVLYAVSYTHLDVYKRQT